MDTEGPGTPSIADDADLDLWLCASRDRVPGFIDRHFTWPGTLILHRHAAGPDILRAPANVLLSPVLVLSRALAWVLGRSGLRRAATWLSGRRILLRTSVAARVESLVATEVLGLSPGTVCGPEGIMRAVLEAPHLAGPLRRAGGPAAAAATARRIAQAVSEYSGTRSAMAEVTVALATLAIGALTFRALTPGLVSLAPGVAEALAETSAIAGFPLGSTMGGVWYAVFPPATPPWWIAATVAAMLVAGAVAGAFAGILADPVQARLGIHRRRLLRLIDSVDGELGRGAARPFTPRDHLLARVFDIWDAGLGLLRLFRG